MPVKMTVIAGAALAAAAAAAAAGQNLPASRGARTNVRLMTVDPGHFHAALIQKEMFPGVDKRVDVYAPLGPDLFEHLKRVAAFNSRGERPTSWELEVHAGPDYFERMLRERPGTAVVLSGRNSPKIDRIVSAVKAGLHVLADKPWILHSADLPKVEAALAHADEQRTVAYDIMTERFEITSIVQRALVNDPAVFGAIVTGSASEPGVYMESVHHLMKTVAGAPLIRPAWFFSGTETEGLNDVGTHLVDLVQWTLFPDQALDYRKDVSVLAAERWPTMIPESGFRRVTGEAGFPPLLAPSVRNGQLEYFANTLVTYTLRGIHTTLNVIWDWEAAPGAADTHYAFYKGTKARVEVRQTQADRYRPELFVIPEPSMKAGVLAAVQARLRAIQSEYAGVGAVDRGSEIHVSIPDVFRAGHEAHFAEVAARFFAYVQDLGRLPAWERSHMLAKYFVTTTGTELSRKNPSRVAARRAPR